MLSVIIPAKNEIYLERTIRNILENAEGEIEVIAELDGWIPDPQIIIDDKRVIFIHHKEGIGQRACINHGVSIAKGKFIMKLDAHCAVDKGFDVKLAADCEESWTVVPRMYNLDHVTWKPKLHKITDYMYITSPRDEKPFRAMYYNGGEFKRWHSRKELVDDTMCCMGPGWFMHKSRFLEQGGCDEEHEGGWGQQGIEVSLKAWLSGGALKVNKKTWFAHWFRGGLGFPYPISGSTIERVRSYSRDLWLNGKWDKQTRTIDWLVEKFNPPGWVKEDLTILFYTSNVVHRKILEPVMRSLKRHGYPIVSISQEPMDFGFNIVVPKERSMQNIYKQVLEGAKKATTKYVALCEDDCLYVADHFKFRPTKPFAYNLNRWLLHLDERVYSYRKRPILSQCIADREVLIKNLEERMKLSSIPDEYCGEMGCFEKQLGMTEYEYETFETKEPNLVVCHKKNIMGRKYIGKDAEPKTDLTPWGKADYWVDKFSHPAEREYRHRQHSHIAGRMMYVDHLWDNLESYWDWRKMKRYSMYKTTALPFYTAIHEGKQFTDEELRAHPYFEYLLSRMRTEVQDRPDVIERCMFLIKRGIATYYSVKKDGFYCPLDMWYEKKMNRLNLYRGSRRLIIAKLLGIREIPVRIFNSLDLLSKLMPDCTMIPDDSINGLAMKQFIKHNYNGTDKYWIHNYTSLYDKHLGHLRPSVGKILEIGVSKGASLMLWQEAFPKAQIYGVDKDISKATMVSGKRIELIQGRQEDEKLFREVVAPKGKFDIIIDDCGHRSNGQVLSFNILWECLNKGGWYVIEDLYGNYWMDKGEFITILKNKIDELNLKCEIKSIHFYFNICFLEKR